MPLANPLGQDLIDLVREVTKDSRRDLFLGVVLERRDT
jgi:hypothetical protein